MSCPRCMDASGLCDICEAAFLAEPKIPMRKVGASQALAAPYKASKRSRHWADMTGPERFFRKTWERIAYDWNPVFRILQARRYRRLMDQIAKDLFKEP